MENVVYVINLQTFLDDSWADPKWKNIQKKEI